MGIEYNFFFLSADLLFAKIDEKVTVLQYVGHISAGKKNHYTKSSSQCVDVSGITVVSAKSISKCCQGKYHSMTVCLGTANR